MRPYTNESATIPPSTRRIRSATYAINTLRTRTFKFRVIACFVTSVNRNTHTHTATGLHIEWTPTCFRITFGVAVQISSDSLFYWDCELNARIHMWPAFTTGLNTHTQSDINSPIQWIFEGQKLTKRSGTKHGDNLRDCPSSDTKWIAHPAI